MRLTQSCAEALEEAIKVGAYRPGSRLPSEAELAERLAVSRATFRESLRARRTRNISHRLGRGAFVRERPTQKGAQPQLQRDRMIRVAPYH
jgi:GntR family transcriptional repressor for pyruvate dehydrogenase complex